MLIYLFKIGDCPENSGSDPKETGKLRGSESLEVTLWIIRTITTIHVREIILPLILSVL